ncbi:MAG: DNA primase [Bacteroidota bacterium]|nr:DNA primase [Bacteroidota bacterium]
MSNQITSDTGSTNPFLKKSDDQLQISPISDGQNNITDCEPHCLTVVNEEGFLQRILSHKQVLSALLNELQPVNFQELAELTDGESLTKQHYLIISIQEMMKIATNNRWSLAMTDGFVFVFNGAYWKQLTAQEVKRFLGFGAEKLSVKKYTARHFVFRDDLYKQFLSSAFLPKPERIGQEVLINLLNGTFVIKPKEQFLKSFDRRDFLTYQLPFEYSPGAKAPLFEKYLNRVLPDVILQKVMAEYISYVFIRHKTLKLEKALILYGGGSNGKSVAFSIITALLGPENVSNFSLQSLTNASGYQRAKISDKLLNYASEISPNMDSTLFKQLISGEPIEARLPYKEPFMLEDYCKFIFNTNQLPSDVEHNEAFFRRFIILPFDVTISEDERDPELANKIIANELPGVFNWVLEGLERLLVQRRFTKSETIDRMVTEYKQQSDSVKLFIDEECYTIDLNSDIALKKIYNTYRDYCSESGYKSCSLKNFSERLRNNGFTTSRKNFGTVVHAAKPKLFLSSALPTPAAPLDISFE